MNLCRWCRGIFDHFNKDMSLNSFLNITKFILRKRSYSNLDLSIYSNLMNDISIGIYSSLHTHMAITVEKGRLAIGFNWSRWKVMCASIFVWMTRIKAGGGVTLNSALFNSYKRVFLFGSKLAMSWILFQCYFNSLNFVFYQSFFQNKFEFCYESILLP